MTRMTASLLGALCALLSIAGCSANGNSNGGQQPNNVQQGPGMQPGGGFMVDGPSQGMRAPVVLRLRGPDPVPAAGDIRLDLEVIVNEPIGAPFNIQIQLPQGTQLVAGMAAETVQLSQVGTLQRQFVVRTSGPLAAPILVTGEARSASGAYGLHAKRQYPPAAAAPMQTGARPPMARPPSAPPR